MSSWPVTPSKPSTRMRPAEGRMAVARSLSKVVFPEPLCPVRSRAAPRWRVSETRTSAHRAPKRLLTSFNSSATGPSTEPDGELSEIERKGKGEKSADKVFDTSRGTPCEKSAVGDQGGRGV